MGLDSVGDAMRSVVIQYDATPCHAMPYHAMGLDRILSFVRGRIQFMYLNLLENLVALLKYSSVLGRGRMGLGLNLVLGRKRMGLNSFNDGWDS